MPGLDDILAQAGVEDVGDTRGEASERVTEGLSKVRQDVVQRLGRLPLFGRYHRHPRSLADDYEISTKTLGSGWNGAVTLATSRHRPGLRYAVKQIGLKDLSAAKITVLRSEVLAFLCMDHPHIARLVDVYESARYLSLVMECMEGGELSDAVGKNETMPEKKAANIMRQVLLALNYLHANGMVHRDIKHGNILFENKAGDNHVKLIDFGFTKLRNSEARMHTKCGTMAYMAPEVLGIEGYTSKCDLWSLGVVLFELLTGDMPYSQPPDPDEDEPVQMPGKLSPVARDFLSAALEMDPAKRICAEKALQHPWITGAATPPSPRRARQGFAALGTFASLDPARRLCLLIASWSLSRDEIGAVRDIFLAIDSQQKGRVAKEDLKELGRDAADRIVASSGDASRREVHFMDFLAAMLWSQLERHEELLRAAFHRFDVNDVRRITVDSFRKVTGDCFDGRPVEDLVKDIGSETGTSVSFDEFSRFLQSERVSPSSSTKSATKCCVLL